MPFMCSYMQDWERVRQINRLERRRNRKWKRLWLVLLVFSLLMLAFCLAARLSGWLAAVYAGVAAFCLYRAFLRRPLLVRRQWRRSCSLMGAERYQVVFTLGNNIRIEEGGSHAVELPWTRLKAVTAAGDFLRLEGGERREQICFYLPRAGFEDGTGDAFLAWLGLEHPGLLKN